MKLVDTVCFVWFSRSSTSIFQNSRKFLAFVVEKSVLCEVQTEIHKIENNFFIQTLNKRKVRDTFTSYCTVNSLFVSTDRHELQPVGSAQVEYCASWDWVYVWSPCAYVHVQSTPVLIQTPTHSNLVSHSMTASPPVLSTNSILAPASSHFTFIAKRSSTAPISKNAVFLFFKLLRSEKA